MSKAHHLRSNHASSYFNYIDHDFGHMCVTEGLEEPCKKKDLGDGVYSFEYYPTTPGNYIITITWGGQHIPRRLEYFPIVLVIVPSPNSKMAKKPKMMF